MHRAPLDNLLQQFFNWRLQLSRELHALQDWMRAEKLDNPSLTEKIPRLLQKLEQEKITIAVVAEFSRGKTELINALFFADLGQRLLPSGAGTTTMCPTEIMYDPTIPPGLRLLPIQTRESHENLYEFKNSWDGWAAIDFDMHNPDSVSEACKPLAETIMVNIDTAERYGLYDPSSGDTALIEGGMIEIPRWRHAVFNYPHPLLKQGLVIVDTPGLNAIGTEHELTLSTIPNAHAILFILGADTGVTKSDRAIWQDHIASAGIARGNCVVALNKIDTMWDDLRPAHHYASEVEQQVKKSAQFLGIPPERIFPVSAQKGLIARIQHNAALLERSRLLPLEKALAQELPQAHHTVMQLAFKAEVEDLLRRIEFDLQSRQDHFNERLTEVSSLQGKNRASLMTSAEDAAAAMELFSRVAERFEKLNVIVTRQGHGLMNTLDPKLWQLQISATRKKMQASIFSKGVVDAMKDFFADTHANLESARSQADELHGLVGAIYERFANEHGFRQPVPQRVPFERYFSQLEWLKQKLDMRFSSLIRVLTSAKSSYTGKYFDALAGNVQELLRDARLETEMWLKDIMGPLESEVHARGDRLAEREQQVNLAAQSGQTVEQQMLSLDIDARRLLAQKNKLAELRSRLENILPEDSNWWIRDEAA
ncbi:MAG: hypothetical protein RL020_245 [Pseudomonadota bacterium]|jgi:Dynamin family